MNEQIVIVSSVVSPSDFCVLFEDYAKQKVQFQNNIQSIATNEMQPKSINLNDIYYAKSGDQWYRARVTKFLNERNSVEVLFIDNGKVGVKEVSNLKKCGMTVEGKAIKCSLLTKIQLKKPGNWSDEMKTTFKFLTGKRKLLKMITINIADDIRFVDLLTVDRVQNFSIADYLMSVNNIPITPAIEIKLKPIKKLKITGSTVVKIRNIISPSEFYVSFLDFEQDKEVMQIELSVFYEQNPSNISLPAPGVKFATKNSIGVWHRVEVLEWPDSEGLVRVNLMDDGTIDDVPWYMLCELDEQFYDFPRYALKFSLGGIKPVGGFWSDDSINFMKNLLKKVENQITVIEFAGGVKMFVDSPNMKTDINQSMVQHKHATLINKTVKTIPDESSNMTSADDSIFHLLHHIEIIDQGSFDPFSISVKFLEYSDAVKTVIDENIDGITWKVGDNCLVFWSANENVSCHWERGTIIRQKKKAHVFLTDLRMEIEVSISKLRKCPAECEDLKSFSILVRLSCQPIENWTKEDDDTMRLMINSCTQFYIMFNDFCQFQISSDMELRPVILWGKQADGGSLNIVNELEERGLVSPLINGQQVKQTDKKNWSFLSHYLNEESKRKSGQNSTIGRSIIEIGEFIIKLEIKLITAWLPAVPITSSHFYAKVTHVDQYGCIIMHHVDMDWILNKVNETINQHFKTISHTDFPFVVGNTCLVQFENDALYYRGQVIKIFNEDECSVLFIDFGNIQKCQKKHLYEYVICSEVPVLAQRFKLENPPIGIDGNLDQTVLDKLHVCIVDHEVYVCVNHEDVKVNDPTYVKRCTIRSGGHIIETYRDAEKMLKLDSDIE